MQHSKIPEKCGPSEIMRGFFAAAISAESPARPTEFGTAVSLLTLTTAGQVRPIETCNGVFSTTLLISTMTLGIKARSVWGGASA